VTRVAAKKAKKTSMAKKPKGVEGARPGIERTLILLKPDAVARGLAGEIIARFERKGLEFVGLKLIRIDPALAGEHYAEHRGKPFYEGLVSFITSGPVVAGVLEGRGAIALVRRMLGATSGQRAEPGTVRGDYSISDRNNLVHASDGPESARSEIARFFTGDELVAPLERDWIYDRTGDAPE
jgi:nucleoside-diphosphate kinase